MWLPHFGLIFWPDSEACKTTASDADKEPRTFFVNLVLEDTAARKIKSSTLRLNKEESRSITIPDGRKIGLKCQRNEDGLLSNIVARVVSPSRSEAVRDAYNSLAYFFSFLSLATGSNLAIWAIVVFDEKHSAKWNARPQVGAPEDFGLPLGLGFDDAFRVVLSLYREGKNAASPFYRFFCFHKILEAFYGQNSLLQRADKFAREKNIPVKRPRRKITREMMIQALASHHPEFQDLTFSQFYSELEKDERLSIAHVFPYEGTPANLDDFALFTEFALVGNITDLVVRQLIQDEIELWSMLAQEGAIKLPSRPPGY